MLAVADILALHDAAPARWSGDDVVVAPAPAPGVAATFAEAVEAGHFANWTIWNLEDEARRRDVGDARIAAVKRAIDPWNQRRNDLMEAVDAAVLRHFAKVSAANAELHSETAGMMIDRLSILALKVRNMERVGAAAAGEGDEALATECAARAALLVQQRADLAGCLDRLFADLGAGRRIFRVYRQLKSYNDPRLNPVLRAAARPNRD